MSALTNGEVNGLSKREIYPASEKFSRQIK
jgi:hypothetical protein